MRQQNDSNERMGSRETGEGSDGDWVQVGGVWCSEGVWGRGWEMKETIVDVGGGVGGKG